MRNIRTVCAAAGAAFLVGCGGGGSTSGAAATASSGLVPAAAPVGATLAAEAASFRPLREGGVWHYRGTETRAGQLVAHFESTTRMSGVTATGATETTDNAGNAGPQSQVLTVAQGSVTVREDWPLVPGAAPTRVDVVQLRSPVRVNDQVVILDRHIADIGVDLDGDRKNDAMDVAAYARVVGRETYVDQNTGSLDTVRVDTVFRVRTVLSSDGRRSDPVDATLSSWYAEGIGMVRQLATTPDPLGGPGLVTEERLVYHDGGSTGFGPLPLVAATVPASSQLLPGQSIWAGSIVSAHAFPDHVLMFVNEGYDRRYAVSLDLRGAITGVQHLGTLDLSRTAQHPGGLIVVEERGFDLVMHRLDPHGVRTGPADGVTLQIKPDAYLSARANGWLAGADADTVWLVFERSAHDGVGPRNELVLRRYAHDGSMLGAEEVLQSEAGYLSSMDARAGRATFAWLAANNDLVIATAAATGPVSSRVLPGGQPGSPSFARAFTQADGGHLLVWPVYSLPQGGAAGLRLAADLTPVRSGTSWLDEVVDGTGTYDSSTPQPGWAGGRLAFASVSFAELVPGVTQTDRITSVHWVRSDAGPVGSEPVQAMRTAFKSAHMAVYPDRVILIGGEYWASTVVVFAPPP